MAVGQATPARRGIVDWLDTVGKWALAAPLFVAAVTFIVLAPAVVAVRLSEWTFSTGVLALEVAAVTVLMILTSAGLWWAFTGRRVAERLRFGRFEPAVRSLMVAFFAVASFAALTSLLYLEGVLAISRPIDREIVIDKTSEVYVWHLADTVPLLDIPQNLEWLEPFEFEDRIGGLLLTVFTAIVILPLIQVVRVIATGYRREPYEEAVLKALRTRSRGWRARPLRGEQGNERALLEGDVRILVDVMQSVWTEDAPVERLEFVREFFGVGQGVDGYLLVVDAVAGRARDRIEKAFAESPFPARLAVWRPDQPGVHLAQAAEELTKAIEPAEPS
jgi:hypothetical protein